jgi:hypothetical protein
MKHIFNLFLFSLLVLTLNSCKKDEGKLPEISFKTGGNYTSSDATFAEGTVVNIGIHAKKSEEEDVLKKFNVSSSTDGGTPTTLEDITLTGADEDQYDADYTFTVPAGSAGHNFKLTFTVTNRDGLTNHVELTLTAN